MGTPQPGNYTLGDITRVASTPSEAVRLTRDGWTPVGEASHDVAKTEAPKPKKPAEN